MREKSSTSKRIILMLSCKGQLALATVALAATAVMPAALMLTPAAQAAAPPAFTTPLPPGSPPSTAIPAPVLPSLSAAQIVDKNATARGGMDAWRKVQTMVWIGHLQSAASGQALAAFILEMKRPDKQRFDVRVRNERSIRAFDGRDGWKLRPLRGGKSKVTPYSAEELRFARDAPGIGGLLVDHEAKGPAVTFDGTETVDGRPAYRLAVKLPSGATRHVWIDARSFLEVGYDREARDPAGHSGTVFVSYRDFRATEGLQIPMTAETSTPDGRPGERMVIDRVVVNPPLKDSEFLWPGSPVPNE